MNQKHPYRATILPVPEGTHRPLWSVMIPTYNCANYLRETLASVLAQDLGAEIMQIEVIDDHSTKDDPEAVVRELAGDRVSFYRQPENVGYIRNFETCLQRSRGQLIHLLHGDDCVLVGFYSRLQLVFEQNPEVGAAFCRHIYMDVHGHWQGIAQLEQSESGILSNWLEKIAAGQRILTPSVVVRRDVYEHLGGFDRRIVCCGEDWEMWVRIAAHYSVGYEVEPLAVYRFKPLESLALTRIVLIMEDMRMATDIIEHYLSQHLPSNIAYTLLKQARENLAYWTLGVARQTLSESNRTDGITLLRESFKCSQSPKIWQRVFQTFLKGELAQIKRVISHTISVV